MGRKGKKQNKTKDPKFLPSPIEIGWAAGIYEGEGSSGRQKSNNFLRVIVTQKDTWILERLIELFGGAIYRHTFKGKFTFHTWYIGGAKAKKFLNVIYSWLSPRRKIQVEKALQNDRRKTL